MMQTALMGTVGAYIALAVLLLALLIASLWRSWIKAVAIVLTTLVCFGSYVSISGMIGWPSGSQMPRRFNLVATRIVEPDALRDKPGHIYLWIEAIDDNQVIISAPRAYEVPYNADISAEVAVAQQLLDTGAGVMGELDTREGQSGAAQTSVGSADEEADTVSIGSEGGQATGGGAFERTEAGMSLTFSEMAPVGLPEKVDID